MTSAGAGTPAVSVVVATYDRPRALAAALASIRAQTFEDWEVVVVGDACDERTAGVVEALADPRFRYLNLARNVGEQSGPNNVGAAAARAELVAYLNHDDLWFPDHLASCVDAIRARQADLVFAANANVTWSDPVGGATTVVLDGRGVDGRYWPAPSKGTVPASDWLVRRSLLDELGGWRSAGECRSEPSQDLLFRAHRAGKRLCSTGAMTVVTFPSGLRQAAYVGDQANEQERWLARLGDPSARAELLAAASAAESVEARRPRGPRERAWTATTDLAARVGLDARALDFAVRRRLARGAYLAELRRRRGLHDLTGSEDDVVAALWQGQARSEGPTPLDRALSFGRGGEGLALLAGGWSQVEEWGVWSEGRSARLVVEVDPARGDATSLVLEVVVRCNTSVPQGRQRVHVVAGSTSEQWELADDEPATHVLRTPTEGRRFVTVGFTLPFAGPSGEDRRSMAIGLEQLTVRLG